MQEVKIQWIPTKVKFREGLQYDWLGMSDGSLETKRVRPVMTLLNRIVDKIKESPNFDERDSKKRNCVQEGIVSG